ncbi:hypothetical protein ACQKD8_18485 [Pseudomonas sp. NPDC077405]|uniref:hypothetical protein n=1 Tax=Stutzerimonas nitrititolerans TaxID=2482751 RepID=UPI0028B04B99|nr:hypothetical protein [Stutzerimonas nitrititolerans]
MDLKPFGVVLTCMFAVAGCGEDDVAVRATPQTQVAPESLVQNVTTQGAQQKGDSSVPWDEYIDLNGLPHGQLLSYLLVAKSKQSFSDEQKLESLSLAYMSEPDTFEKQHLAKAELPRIQRELDNFRRHDYYSVPVSTYAEYPLNLSNILIGPYSVSESSFPVTSYGQYCWQAPLRNRQGVSLLIQPSSTPCALRVEDESMARTIESARATGALAVKGRAYLYVPGVANGQLEAQVMGVHLELINSQTQTTIASVEL